MAKSLNLWTFIIGGIVGGAIAYMGRGELEKILPKIGGGGGGDAALARRMIANRARARAAYGY